MLAELEPLLSHPEKSCDLPSVVQINESKYFTPKPASANVAPPSSGQTINVLHLSDWHIDPRYDIGSEANCSQYLCCRVQSTNTKLHTTSANASVPASRFGYLYCDSPADLALSAFDTMPQFFNLSSISFAIFTGDIVSHDDDDQLSRAYIEYEETITYQTFKAQMGNIPVYPTLGMLMLCTIRKFRSHETALQAIMTRSPKLTTVKTISVEIQTSPISSLGTTSFSPPCKCTYHFKTPIQSDTGTGGKPMGGLTVRRRNMPLPTTVLMLTLQLKDSESSA